MFNLFKNAASFISDNSRENKGAASFLTGVLKRIAIMKFLPIILGIALFLFLFVSTLFSLVYDMELFQMVDPSSGGKGGAFSVGVSIYTQEDFDDAVELTHSVPTINRCDFDDFNSKLAPTTYKNMDTFNSYIKETVKKTGWGTREGVVAAAMALAYEYPKATGYKYFYTFNDPYSDYDCPCADDQMRHGTDGIVRGLTYLDCRAFVQWSIYNGGYDAEDFMWIDGPSLVGTLIPSADIRKLQPADAFATSGQGHTWIVVGVFEDGYYAAEEFGCGNGLVVNFYSWDNAYGDYSGAGAYDLSNYYDNINNVRPE